MQSICFPFTPLWSPGHPQSCYWYFFSYLIFNETVSVSLRIDQIISLKQRCSTISNTNIHDEQRSRGWQSINSTIAPSPRHEWKLLYIQAEHLQVPVTINKHFHKQTQGINQEKLHTHNTPYRCPHLKPKTGPFQFSNSLYIQDCANVFRYFFFM